MAEESKHAGLYRGMSRMAELSERYKNTSDDLVRDALAEEALNIIRYDLPRTHAILQKDWQRQRRLARRAFWFRDGWAVLIFGALILGWLYAAPGFLWVLVGGAFFGILSFLRYRERLRQRGLIAQDGGADPQAWFLRRAVRQLLEGPPPHPDADPPSSPGFE